MKRPTTQEVRRALDVLAAHFGAELAHGKDLIGQVRVDGLDVDVVVRPRNVVGKHDIEAFRQRALEELARWSYGCDRYVRDRHSIFNKDRLCRSPVSATVISRRGDGTLHYSFCCKAHVRAMSVGARVLGVLPLSAPEVKRAATERARRTALRSKGVLVPGDDPRVDTTIEAAIVTLSQIMGAERTRRDWRAA
jgi:hypothetical protein